MCTRASIRVVCTIAWLALPMASSGTDENDGVVWTDGTLELKRSEMIDFIHNADSGIQIMRPIYNKVVAAGTNLVFYWAAVLRESPDSWECNVAIIHLRRYPGALSQHYQDVRALFSKSQVLEPSPGLTMMLIETVQQCGGAEDSKLVLPYLRNDDVHVRQVAIRCLGEIGDAESLRALEAYLMSIQAPLPGVASIKTNEVDLVRRAVDQLKTRLAPALPR